MLLELGLGGLAAGAASYFFLNDQPMRPAPQREGKVLCDFHAHPSKKNSLDDIVGMLGSPGLVGLAAKYIDKSGEDILLYEEAVDIARVKDDPTFAEITPGQLAKYKQGYFARTQEVKADVFHLLAMGWKGDYLQPYTDYRSIKDAVMDIHNRNGIVLFNHPYFVARGGVVVQLANEEEVRRMKVGYVLVDEVEAHNSFCINLIPVLLSARQANRMAEESLQGSRFKGMAGSDCHRQLRQAKIVGNYLARKHVDKGMEGIVTAVKEGKFERYGSFREGPYVSRGSWMMGVAGDIVKAMR